MIPRDLVGKTLRLVTRLRSDLTIRWRVRGFGSGIVRLETVNSRKRSIVDWPELRNYIQTGRIEVEP